MPGIGDDLKDVFREVGVAYTILRPTGNITGEYLDYTENRQVTKPFTVENQLEVEIAYDSKVVIGDLIQFIGDGRVYLVAHTTPTLVENTQVSVQCQLYKCNAAVTVERPVITKGFSTTITFSPFATGVRVLLDSKNYGAREDYSPRPTSAPERDSYAMYVQKVAGLLEDDRIIVPGGLHGKGPGGQVRLRVVQFDDWTFRGISIAYLGEDPRP